MGDDNAGVKLLADALGSRLTDMTTLIAESNRNAAAAAGAAIKTQDAVDRIEGQLVEVRATQRDQAGKLEQHGNDIAALKKVCSERPHLCGARLEDASKDVRQAVKPLYARVGKQSKEIDSLRSKLSEVREDSSVIDARALERLRIKGLVAKWAMFGLKVLGALLLATGAGAGVLEVVKLLLGS